MNIKPSYKDIERRDLARAAIKKAGGVRALAIALSPADVGADEIEVLMHRINKWMQRAIPLAWVPRVSLATGVEPHDLRPDVFTPATR
jgi:hypothetical protein